MKHICMRLYLLMVIAFKLYSINIFK
uniref:Uncharacterized protein n=1 Tax=Anguilla anguilla TaxID=7936 RepID=A0A0E9W2X0_ANGAN